VRLLKKHWILIKKRWHMCGFWHSVTFWTGVTAVCTFFLGVTTIGLLYWAIWGQWKHEEKYGPVLDFDFQNSSKYFMKLNYQHYHNIEDDNGKVEYTVVGNVPSYWIRCRVVNMGRKSAENISVYLEEIWYQNNSGNYVPLERHIPLNLRWSHMPEGENTIFPLIEAGMNRYFDLAHIMEPEQRDQLLQMEEWPFWYPPIPFPERFKTHLEMVTYQEKNPAVLNLDTVVKPSSRSYFLLDGHYLLQVSVACANAPSITRCFQLDFTGKWTSEETRMRVDEVQVKIVDNETARRLTENR
jgi:hypothetical protein